MKSHSLYLHIPFCRHLCSYCDFNTYAGLDELIPAYIVALCKEIEYVADYFDERLPVHTIFIGGGTPSILPVKELEKVIHTNLRLSPSVKSTMVISYASLSSNVPIEAHCKVTVSPD